MIFDPFKATLSAVVTANTIMVPEAPAQLLSSKSGLSLSIEIGGDEATRSPATSAKPVSVEKSILPLQRKTPPHTRPHAVIDALPWASFLTTFTSHSGISSATA